jgi:hypothetical protein
MRCIALRLTGSVVVRVLLEILGILDPVFDELKLLTPSHLTTHLLERVVDGITAECQLPIRVP